MRIDGEWLNHPGTQALCGFLEMAGMQALFVGGCVRNALLGESVADIDIATDATPDMVVNLAATNGMKVVPTGLSHGTVTVIAGGKPHEVTTLRRDVATDGRHAEVEFSKDVVEDAGRRDFTMNALYANRFGEVLDPIGGLSDLLARHVRFVGDPERRIREDYLRILRFFRFHARYGDETSGLDKEGLQACAAHVAGLDTLSRERVGAEIRKLLSARNPAPTLQAMARAGVLGRVLPDADLDAIARLAALEGGAPPDWMRRLACLGGAVAEDLRLSKAEGRRIHAIRRAAASDRGAAAIGWELGREVGRSAVIVRAARSGHGLPAGWAEDVDRGAAATFPVKAQDLLPLAGRDLGARLASLTDLWLRSDLRLTRNELLR
ncbi:MAG: CCA tRNA nucleotidyltransferase [Tabrizicola sp.]|uniref:CCA tRNA nucleotidyltransferase n=1 Tax=Tabrizicola sp. TaxID=2005166 RepID=UPI0027339C5D|nr:CCA tRNA nucleotidyltransferase [Tabrizicola sp.]MDP3261605.1 CCA tRNA nucleotidyltransferase [Tabrizicola sp.]MDP3648325.1 CCA tRNA nucleotidyltransferase [Paracoccaceae bacterium]MDZ4066900.1 CCA tRNA nucleotidyltransferase [Tabrizicola sp.]